MLAKKDNLARGRGEETGHHRRHPDSEILDESPNYQHTIHAPKNRRTDELVAGKKTGQRGVRCGKKLNDNDSTLKDSNHSRRTRVDMLKGTLGIGGIGELVDW